MEKLYYNLSEEEFSGIRKILIWIFAGFFFLAGVAVVLLNLVFGHSKSMPLVLSAAPFSISLVVAIIGLLSSVKRKDQYFMIDDEKLEFRFGIFRPVKTVFRWIEINEVIMPHKQKKAMLSFKDGRTFIMDLSWLQRRKSSLIRKHIYQAAIEKHLKISKVQYLRRKSA